MSTVNVDPQDETPPACRLVPGEPGGGLSRRGFLRLGVGALGAVALLEAGGAGFAFLRARSLEGEYGGLITVGNADKFQPGSVTEFQQERFYLIRAADGGFLAVYNRCTHLGCTVNWVQEQNEFVCPCHAASFDFYGNFEGPPVPRPLDTFPVDFENGLVRVNTALPQQRKTFDQAQLAYCPAEPYSQASLPGLD
jgi:cytochrome b6-f complex iron-sulfur subunit